MKHIFPYEGKADKNLQESYFLLILDYRPLMKHISPYEMKVDK